MCCSFLLPLSFFYFSLSLFSFSIDWFVHGTCYFLLSFFTFYISIMQSVTDYVGPLFVFLRSVFSLQFFVRSTQTKSTTTTTTTKTTQKNRLALPFAASPTAAATDAGATTQQVDPDWMESSGGSASRVGHDSLLPRLRRWHLTYHREGG